MLIPILAILLGLLSGSPSEEDRPARPVGLPQDWSTRHIIFAKGASPEIAATAERDPRYWINWMLRSAGLFQKGRTVEERFRRRHMQVDWAMSLGAGSMPVGETPAKYSFSINGTPDCVKDCAIFTINATPVAGQANIVAFNNLYTGAVRSSGGHDDTVRGREFLRREADAKPACNDFQHHVDDPVISREVLAALDQPPGRDKSRARGRKESERGQWGEIEELPKSLLWKQCSG